MHKRFREVSPDVVPRQMTGDEAHTVRVPREQLETLSELKVETVSNSVDTEADDIECPERS